VLIREATEQDWPGIWPFWHQIALARDTYCWHPDTDEPTARRIWMEPPPGRVYAVLDGQTVVASAQLHPNYGPASHVANASFIVDPDRSGEGIGRRLVRHVLDRARAAGFRAMVFNAVVETNANAVHLYRTLGFTIVGTVPEAFDHPTLGPVGLHVMHLPL
jgi:ribosomal protein S18 acetylase RimI-like enzyme